MAAASFCGQEIEVDPQGRVRLSKLLLWYKSDFGATDNDVLTTLATFVRDEELRSKILSVVANETLQEKIAYKDYNWKINASSQRN
jgi:hypothetical protein